MCGKSEKPMCGVALLVSHLFSMPSLIAQVEGYFGKHFTLVFSHIGAGCHSYSERNGQLVTMCTGPSIE